MKIKPILMCKKDLSREDLNMKIEDFSQSLQRMVQNVELLELFVAGEMGDLDLDRSLD